MARDLDLLFPPVEAIHGVPIVREGDGLAMSSRNARLDGKARAAAPAIHRGLCRAESLAMSGERSASRLAEVVRGAIEEAPPLSLDRIALVGDAPAPFGERRDVALGRAAFGFRGRDVFQQTGQALVDACALADRIVQFGEDFSVWGVARWSLHPLIGTSA